MVKSHQPSTREVAQAVRRRHFCHGPLRGRIALNADGLSLKVRRRQPTSDLRCEAGALLRHDASLHLAIGPCEQGIALHQLHASTCRRAPPRREDHRRPGARSRPRSRSPRCTEERCFAPRRCSDSHPQLVPDREAGRKGPTARHTDAPGSASPCHAVTADSLGIFWHHIRSRPAFVSGVSVHMPDRRWQQLTAQDRRYCPFAADLLRSQNFCSDLLGSQPTCSGSRGSRAWVTWCCCRLLSDSGGSFVRFVTGAVGIPLPGFGVRADQFVGADGGLRCGGRIASRAAGELLPN